MAGVFVGPAAGVLAGRLLLTGAIVVAGAAVLAAGVGLGALLLAGGAEEAGTGGVGGGAVALLGVSAGLAGDPPPFSTAAYQGCRSIVPMSQFILLQMTCACASRPSSRMSEEHAASSLCGAQCGGHQRTANAMECPQ